MPIFNFSTLAAATNYFSNASMIGQGGFGPVYKVIEVISYETLTRRCLKPLASKKQTF